MKLGLPLSVLLSLGFDADAATFVVTNSLDSGAGSLRQAIIDANQNFGGRGQDTIEFNIDRIAPYTIPTINLSSPLPAVTAPVTIDGTTENAGYVQLNGTSVGAGAAGLRIIAGECTVRGLIINRFLGNGIEIIGPKGTNAIQQNRIGTTAAGLAPSANLGHGILISNSPDNIVGGASPLGNVLSANGGNGVEITGSSATNNRVLGNLIGTDVTGGAALGNSGNGVMLENDALGNAIGGAARNVISANGGNGIEIRGTGVTNLLRLTSTDVPKVLALSRTEPPPTDVLNQTNFSNLTVSTVDPVTDVDVQVTVTYGPVNGLHLSLIAPSATEVELSSYGSFDDFYTGGNNGYGANFAGTIFDDESLASLVHHTAPYMGNFVPAGHLSDFDLKPAQGVWKFRFEVDRFLPFGETNTATLVSWSLLLTTVHGNEVSGNFIGTDASGQGALGNSADGVFLNGSAGNRIGGASVSLRNVISANRRDGVRIDGAGANANLVRGNFIGTDATGTTRLGNDAHGAEVSGGAVNAIGGVDPADGNVIAGNDSAGVLLSSSAAYDRVQNNFIGTDETGTLNLGNGTNGIRIVGGASDNLLGGQYEADKIARPYVPVGGNLIAFNGGDAVSISSVSLLAPTVRNRISGNTFISNTGRAIDYTERSVPSPLMPPVLGSAIRANHAVTIYGVTAAPFAPQEIGWIEFYASDTGDASHSGLRQTFLGAFRVESDEAGNLSDYDIGLTSFPITGIATLPLSNFITATLTDSEGYTSEFSTGVPLEPGAAISMYERFFDGLSFTLTPVGYSQVGLPVPLDLYIFNIGPDAAENVIVSNTLPSGVPIISVIPSQGACTNFNGLVVCDLGTLAVREGPLGVVSNATAKIRVTFAPTAAGTFKNTFALSSSTPPGRAKGFTTLYVREPVPWSYETTSGSIRLMVPTTAAPFAMKYTDSLSPPITWRLVQPYQPVIVGDQFVFTTPLSASNRFFWLFLLGN
jgi:uncharacterized repeat protein (TIGR01451 family)